MLKRVAVELQRVKMAASERKQREDKQEEEKGVERSNRDAKKERTRSSSKKQNTTKATMIDPAKRKANQCKPEEVGEGVSYIMDKDEGLESDEEEDNIAFSTTQGKKGTEVLGSRFVDGILHVYLEWDNGVGDWVTLEKAEAVYADWKELFDNCPKPSQMRKWLTMVGKANDATKSPNKRRVERKKRLEPKVRGDKDNYSHDNITRRSPNKTGVQRQKRPGPTVGVENDKCTHDDITGYINEELPGHCNEGCYLCGKRCMDCGKRMVNKKPEAKEYRPSATTPAKICQRIVKVKCDGVLCIDCYSVRLETTGRSRRKRT